jgi:hypothetical protein
MKADIFAYLFLLTSQVGSILHVYHGNKRDSRELWACKQKVMKADLVYLFLLTSQVGSILQVYHGNKFDSRELWAC